MSLQEGVVFNNRYRVLRPLGEGGFGRTYLVEDSVMNRQCVVKASRRRDAAHRIQFEREAKMLAKLNHPNLPAVYDYFVENDRPYLVMEYIEGTDLQELSKGADQPFAVHQVLRWAGDLLDALIYLHNQDPPVIHRDIKPSNVCVTPEGKAVLLDFGIARLLEGTHTLTGAQALTKHYAPIEQYPVEAARSYETLRQYLEELKAVGIHTGSYSDIYSLGATLYFALTLLGPPDACWRVIGEEALAIRKYNPAVPDFVIGALDQALIVDPRKRCHTAAELKRLLHPTSKPLPPSPPLLWKWIAVGVVVLLAVFAGLFLSGLALEWFGGLTPKTPSPVPPAAMLLSTPTPLLTLKPSHTPSTTPTATSSPTPNPLPYLTVSDEQVNVYAGPGEMYAVLGQLQRGSRLLILGRSEDGVWFQVDYLGWRGWVAAQSVSVDVDPSALPAVEAPPTPVNRPPVIQRDCMASAIIEACGAISMTCQASDPDDDELAYIWETSDGLITGEGDAVTYDAPEVTGGQTVTLTVQDEHKREAKRSIQVQIVLPQPPSGTFEPVGVFDQVWHGCEIRRKLGWATGEDTTTPSAQQFFERGVMFWRKYTGEIYVLTEDEHWQVYIDDWEEGMDEYSCPDVAPRRSPPTPIRGFGKVWCEQLGGTNAGIGWATTDERGYDAHWQTFEHGLMCQGLDGAIYVFYEDHSWQSYPFPTSGNSPSGSDSSSRRIRVGGRARVCTAYHRLAMRSQPGRSSSEITRLEPGTYVTVVDGPAYADGWPWWEVRIDSGAVGWVAEGGDDVDPYFICPER